MTVWLCLACFLSSYFLTQLILQYAVKKSLVDIPNARSSHSIPTPRGGGLSVVITFLFMVAILSFYSKNAPAIGLMLSGLAVAAIGFWDDHKHIPAGWRLLVHTGSATLALFCLPSLPELFLFHLTFPANWLAAVVFMLALVWLLNLYNFMDGIDGIASSETISVALSMAVLLFIQGQFDYGLLLLLLSVAVSGFLVWNWPHAKIFMGDACSGFLGFILGIFALLTSATGVVNLWSWMILLGLFITDASFTLVKRILNKQVWYEAHASHAYQHYARQLIQHYQQQGFEHRLARTKSHRRINFLLIFINITWLLPLAITAALYPFWAVLVTLIAFAPLLYIAHILEAGSSSQSY